MGNLILVGLGGFVGSVLRYLVSGYVHQVTKSVEFPYGTLFVNLTGCFAIGFLALIDDKITSGLATLEKVQVRFYRSDT